MGPSGPYWTQVGLMLAPWTLLSGMVCFVSVNKVLNKQSWYFNRRWPLNVYMTSLLWQKNMCIAEEMKYVYTTWSPWSAWCQENSVSVPTCCLMFGTKATCGNFLEHIEAETNWPPFSNVFSWITMNKLWIWFHWSLFPSAQLTIFHHLFTQFSRSRVIFSYGQISNNLLESEWNWAITEVPAGTSPCMYLLGQILFPHSLSKEAI